MTGHVVSGRNRRRVTRAATLGLVAIVFQGCVTHQYVHWEQDWQEAADRVAESSPDRDIRVTLRTGQGLRAARVFLMPDSLIWVPVVGSEELSTPLRLALAEVDSVVVAGETKEARGAAIGALSGLLLTGVPSVIWCLQGNCSGQQNANAKYVVPGIAALVGTLVGAVLGSQFHEWFHLVP